MKFANKKGVYNTTLRNSHLEVFCEKGVLRNFAKFFKEKKPDNLFQKQPSMCILHILQYSVLKNLQENSYNEVLS